jgi:tetratricopeptide (TPR) repeat protein
MKRPLVTGVIAAVALGAAAAVFYFSWRAGVTRSVVLAGIPQPPDLSARPAELQQRIQACESRARTGPDRIEALGELSRLYHANGLYAQAGQCYQALLQVDPGNPRWPYRLASILAGYGQLDDALPLWRRAAEQAPDYLPALIKQGDALLKMNRNAEAAAVYDAALKREPQNSYALLGLARIDMDAERWDAARVRLETVVTQTNWGLGYDLLPAVYEKLGQADRAAAIRGRSKTFDTYRDMPDPWVNELIEDCYDIYRLSLVSGNTNLAGDVPSAVRLLERALALAPDNASVHFQLGNLYFKQKELVKARRFLERCVALMPDHPDAWLQLSNVLTAIGDAGASERALSAGLARCPGSPGLHMERGNRLTAAGRLEEATAEFQETIRLRPQEAGGYLALAQTYFKLGRTAEGVEALKRSLGEEPDNPLVLSTLALWAIQTGDEAAAGEWLRRVRLQPRIRSGDRQTLENMFQQRFGRPLE